MDLSIFKSKLQNNTGFISVMHANNETGVLQPIKELVQLAKQSNPLTIFHTDAAQSIGKTTVDVEDLLIDFLSVCPHKFYGPKGIGALYIRQGFETKLEKQIHGANHEKNMRAGTENVLEIVGLGKACELVHKEFHERIAHFTKTRNLILQVLKKKFNNFIKIHGPEISEENIEPTKEKRLSNTLFVSFPGIEANLILDLLSDKVACSAGAACHSDDIKISHVLEAMGVSPEVAMGTIRISTGLKLTEEEALKAAESICETVSKILGERSLENKEFEEQQKDNEDIKLTKTTHGLGCGCKLPATLLSSLLRTLPKQKILEGNANILVGTETSDDACVYKLSPELALIKTLDFFTPICDNPEDFGEIACANAISDVYAMGGQPLLALNIVAFPIGTLPASVLKRILQGAQRKAEEAGVAILGGHSIEDSEPKFGLSVTGVAHPEFIWKNSSVEHGDFIIVTKKLGVGALMTALKRQILKEKDAEFQEAVASMKMLNKDHCETLRKLENNQRKIVNACTDVTGFGFLGHLKEALESKGLGAEVFFESLKFFEKAKEFVEMGVVPGGTHNNLKFVAKCCVYDEKLSESQKMLINDPQTSGGLMVFVKESEIATVLSAFKAKELEFSVVGKVDKGLEGKIWVRNAKFEEKI